MRVDLRYSPTRCDTGSGPRLLLGLLTILLVGCSSEAPGSGVKSPSPASRRPNVVIYLVDTLRADHLGLYGYERDTSPVLDGWAGNSVVFDKAYAPCSWTKPSMVSLLSGLDPVSHGVEDRLDVIPSDVRLVSERLQKQGYSTFAAVTNPNVLPQWGFDRGFEVYDDLDSAGHGTRADTVSDYVEERMAELSKRQPFLLYLHLLDPHAPYEPPPPFDSRFPKSPAFPANLSIGQYDGEIAFVDSQFKRILDSLESHGLTDDTMTIFVADHGEELFDHGATGHGTSLFDEVVRVPLVIRFPRDEHAGTRVQEPVTITDLVPTILSVLGQMSPPELDGRDLTQLLGGDEPEWANRELFLSLRTTGLDGNLVRGVLGGSFKYLRRSRPIADEALYDLEQDPFELENLAGIDVESKNRLAMLLDAYLAGKSSGIHLRLLNDFRTEPVGCEALLSTAGRFVDVAGVRLESDDRFDVSEDGTTLRLQCHLENRMQSLRRGSRLIPDEDGLVFQISPPDAAINLQYVRLADGRALPLLTKAGRFEATLLNFEPMDSKWSVSDVGQLMGSAGGDPESAIAAAYLGVIRAPAERPDLPKKLLDRLRALGYIGSK